MTLSVHMRLSVFVLHLIMQVLNSLYCCIVLILFWSYLKFFYFYRCIILAWFNPRTPRGYHPPWRFSPVTFLMIPIAKIASAYLLLEMGDTFWHMWHHLDAVTWHMSWRHMYMTVVKIHCFLPLFVNRDNFWCRCDKVMKLVSFST